MKKLARYVLKMIIIPFLSLFSKILKVDKIYKSHLYSDSTEIPSDIHYCLVLGAKLFGDDSITPMLVKRMNVAIELFKERPHITFILSGDGSKRFSNDVQAMYTYLKDHCSIPDSQILLDNYGYTTLDSIQHITPEMDEKGVILLTSSFHMPRCVYICHRLGLHPYALHIEASFSRSQNRYHNRELLSIVKVWFILTFGQPFKSERMCRAIFHLAFLCGRITMEVLHLFGHSHSCLPGKIALFLCPYFFQYATKSCSLTFVMGSSEKISSKCSPDEVATILLTNNHGIFFRKQTANYLFYCKENEFYKIAKYVSSPDIKIYINNFCREQYESAADFELIRNQILSGIDLLPQAEIYLDQTCSLSASLANAIPNPVYFYTP